MEASRARSLGRPPGVRNGEGKQLAPIKKWTAKHDMVVYLHACALLGNDEIAEKMRCTPARVSQILKDPIARDMVHKLQVQMRKKMESDIEDTLVGLNVQAVKNIKQTLEMSLDLIATPQAKIHQDNMSLNLLKGTGVLQTLEDEARESRTSRGTQLNDSLATKLLFALDKSNEADAIRRAEKEIVVEDAEIVK